MQQESPVHPPLLHKLPGEWLTKDHRRTSSWPIQQVCSVSSPSELANPTPKNASHKKNLHVLPYPELQFALQGAAAQDGHQPKVHLGPFMERRLWWLIGGVGKNLACHASNPIITANPITTARLWWHEEELSQHLIQFFLVSFPVALRSHCAFNWRWGYDFKEIISSPHLNAHGGIKKYRVFSIARDASLHHAKWCKDASATPHRDAWISLAKLSNNSAHAGRAKRDPSGHTSMGRLVLHHLRLLFGSHFCPRTHAPASVSAACEARPKRLATSQTSDSHAGASGIRGSPSEFTREKWFSAYHLSPCFFARLTIWSSISTARCRWWVTNVKGALPSQEAGSASCHAKLHCIPHFCANYQVSG